MSVCLLTQERTDMTSEIKRVLKVYDDVADDLRGIHVSLSLFRRKSTLMRSGYQVYPPPVPCPPPCVPPLNGLCAAAVRPVPVAVPIGLV